MTIEEFERHCGIGPHIYRDRGKARLNRLKGLYAAYVKAYRETSLERFYAAVLERSTSDGIRAAAKDRDAGRPMAVVPELL